MTATARDPQAPDARHASLVDEVARIRLLLGAAEGTRTGDVGRPDAGPIADVARAFGLSDFERDILAMAAAVELDGDVAELVSRDGGPTFAITLSALPSPHWDALGPAAPLRWWRLIELDRGTPLTTRPIRIDEHVLHHLTGVTSIDDRLAGVACFITPPVDTALTPAQEAVVRELETSVRELDQPAVVVIDGGDVEGRAATVRRLTDRLGLAAVRIGAASLPAPGPELADTARLIDRDLVLGRAVPIIEPAPGSEIVVDELIGLLEAPLVIYDGEGLRQVPAGRVAVRRTVPWPSSAEGLALWRSALGLGDDDAAPAVRGGLAAAVDEVAAHYRLGAASIGTIARELRARPDRATGHHLHQLCRRRCRVTLDGLAERIEAQAVWDDLVLPPGQAEVLHDIARQVRHRHQVYDEWGFGGPGRRGLGVSALFTGESGTGKTLAAEVLAADLELDLYRIDLSATVSKYIGETEKNLQRLFDAAETSGAVLLFDEADALFGKRGEVRHAHDRYANLEVAYLLGRMETYRGLALLTTNLRANLDRAFLRRLRFVVQFPFPDEAQRGRIWARMFPPGAPTEGLDPARLARLAVTGGSIRAIAVSAAFAAADDGQVITPAHVERAAEIEYAKSDRSLTDTERGSSAMRRAAPRIELTIDEVVMRGVPRSEAEAVLGQIRATLATLGAEWAGEGAPLVARAESSRRLPTVAAPAGSPAALGRAIATAVWADLSTGGRPQVQAGDRGTPG